MDLLIAFFLFIAAILFSLIQGIRVDFAMVFGLLLFSMVARHRGYRLPQIAKNALVSLKSMGPVLLIMVLIGFLTASWRMAGTVTAFIFYGSSLIRPNFFILLVFLLSSLLSYTIGTSFGSAATIGVIFMAFARSGGVNPVITAGAVLSGVYFGDRCSPVSSSANLIAELTDTNIYENVKRMHWSGAPVFLLVAGIYAFLSFRNPLERIDTALIDQIRTSFRPSMWMLLPALLMLILPLCKVAVHYAMLASTLTACLLAAVMRSVDMKTIAGALLFGFQAPEGELRELISGGGLIDMAEVILLLFVCGSYSGIFQCGHMLDGLQKRLTRYAGTWGRFPVTLLAGTAASCLFCNQTLAILMTKDFMAPAYQAEGTKEELALDMYNSVSLIGCFIPWTIGALIPLSFMKVSPRAFGYAFLMYILPLFWLCAKRWYPEKVRKGTGGV